MIEIITFCIFAALCILGIHKVTRPGFLFEAFGQEINGEEELKEIELSYIEDIQDAVNIYIMEQEVNAGSGELSMQLFEDFKDALESRMQIKANEELALAVNLDKARDTLLRKLLRPFSNPITECVHCMSSFWGLTLFAVYVFFPFGLYAFIPLAICGIVEIANYFRK